MKSLLIYPLLVFSILLCWSCSSSTSSSQRAVITVYDGDESWEPQSDMGFRALGEPVFVTFCIQRVEEDQTLRTLSFTLPLKPGHCDGTFDLKTGEWSPELKGISFTSDYTIDYNGVPGDKWIGTQASINVTEFNQEKRTISGVVELDMWCQEKDNTKHLSIVLENVRLD